jgi:Xaa-Pro aminopeptidase
MPIFTRQEMDRRVRAFCGGLAARAIDVAFLHTPDNVYYMSGVPLLSAWGRPMWMVVGQNGPATLVGAMIEQENMEAYSWVEDVRAYDDSENVWQASLRLALDFIEGRGAAPARIGLERNLLTIGVYEVIQAAFPEATLVEVGDLLGELRIIKSEEELRLLRLGGEIARIGANAFLEALGDNVTELAVAASAVAEMDRALGALYPEGGTSTYAYCQAADHTMIPHFHPTGRRLRRGNLIGLNVFPVIWGYCMELERTFVYGEPSEAQRRALDATNDAFATCKAALRPGARMSDVDLLGREVLRRHGYDRYVRHGTGHPHGIMIGAAGREEGGELRAYNQGFIKPQMVNSVEPGIYIPGLGGFRHSDVMIVTGDGAVCATDFPVAL